MRIRPKVWQVLLLLFLIAPLYATPYRLTVLVRDAHTQAPLIGANVYFPKLELGSATDSNGVAVITGLPRGVFVLKVSYMGYESSKMHLTLPLKDPSETVTVDLAPTNLASQQVIVTSTRSNGVIENVPVKVEVLGQSEINEEVAIRPGNVSKLLGEVSGVFVQQTSPVSGVVSFRLEGLPGRYTQLLQDGLPIADRLSNGLTLLQIPPLDLRQVEVVKGPSSLFYGNGAVAGFVNLITKSPGTEPELDLVLNVTSRQGVDGSLFYARQWDTWGLTLLASHSRQPPVDVCGNGFTDIAELNQTILTPRLFWQPNQKRKLKMGFRLLTSRLSGGDLKAVGSGNYKDGYLEQNESSAMDGNLQFTEQLSPRDRLTFKSSIQKYTRKVVVEGMPFSGRQLYTFTELAYLKARDNHNIVMGFNTVTDHFQETDTLKYFYNFTDYNYNEIRVGIFWQDDWRLTSRFMFEPGLRVDFSPDAKRVLLPHLASRWQLSDNLTMRLSLGYGYQTSNLLNYSDYHFLADHTVFWNESFIRPEIARGLNFDLGYKTILNDLVIRMNQALFYNEIQNSLRWTPSGWICGNGSATLYPRDVVLETRGFDSNLYLALDELEFYADYTYNQVTESYENQTQALALTPRHKLNLTLTYEREGHWRVGLEAFYTGSQYLAGAAYSRSYWLLGAMGERYFRNFSLILNVENILDERQSRYEKIVSFPNLPNTPRFRPLYMPLDGLVANLAVWVKL